jgi:hypothetical protein
MGLIAEQNWGSKISWDCPFNSYDSSKITFYLIKPLFRWKDFTPRRIPICLESCKECCVYRTGCSLPDTWNPECQLYWYPESSYQWHWSLGLAHRKNWHPAHQSSHTGGFLLYWLLLWIALLLAQRQLININKLEYSKKKYSMIPHLQIPKANTNTNTLYAIILLSFCVTLSGWALI